MKRKDFLKKTGIGLIAVPIVAEACKSNTDASATTQETTVSTSGDCAVTNSETAGPYPTHTPTSLTNANIIVDRAGSTLTIKLNIRNVNNGCAALKGALVDIWHCDADGNYSEYGGGTLTNAHFLRGRQTTDANGLVTFTSIYPGWYSGRAPHIHVQVFDASGKSLLVTQIAFPENINDTIYTQGVYASRGKSDTKNARDGIFSDGYANELGVVSGTPAAGLTLTHTVNVKA
jgi:protocatechuate 3,4-dioxygenase beta subunit